MSAAGPDTIVVGGGITGVTAAWTLHQAGADVVLLEASDRLGGKLALGSVAGQSAELGADAFLARDPAAADLAGRLGLDGDLVEPATGKVWLWTGGRLRPLPGGTVLGAPTDPVAVARSRVLSLTAMARAGLDVVLPRHWVPGDRSVADAVGARFGPAVVDTLVEPLLGGVYAGRADQLSLESTAPVLAEAARSHRSLLLGLRDLGGGGSNGGPVFQTLASGLSQLTDRMAADLRDRVQTMTRVVDVTRRRRGWRVQATGDGGSGELIAADLVFATPAFTTAEVLAGAAPAAAAELTMIPYASVAVVTLAYPRSADAQMPQGSGMLVPRTEGRLVKAATFVSRKWPHRDTGSRVLVRASVGRIDDDRWRQLDQDELARRVDAEIRWATGISAPAVDAVVTPWERAIPQYLVGHRERVDRIRMALPQGLHVAGAAYDGVGISPCVASAQRAAAGILA